MISTKVRWYIWKRKDRRVKMLAWGAFSPTRERTDTGDQANLALVKLSHNFLFQLWHMKSLEVNTVHWHQLSILVGYSLRPENKKRDLEIFLVDFFPIHVQNHLLDSLLWKKSSLPHLDPIPLLWATILICVSLILPVGWHPRSHLLCIASPSSFHWSSNTHAGLLSCGYGHCSSGVCEPLHISP